MFPEPSASKARTAEERGRRLAASGGTQSLFIGAVRAWAKGVLLWNLDLDNLSGPQNGGCVACRGVVTIDHVYGD
jgi:O-glycosyl hydrolase